MADNQIQISRIGTETIAVPLVGTAPLIVHQFSEKSKRQMLDAMQGLPFTDRLHHGRLGRSIGAEGDRQHYLRATLSEADGLPIVTPLEDQDSARLGLLAQADALLVRPAGDPPREAGDAVKFIVLN